MVLAGLDQVVEHLHNLLGDKRQRPAEDVHEVREKVGVLGVVELLDVQSVVLGKGEWEVPGGSGLPRI